MGVVTGIFVTEFDGPVADPFDLWPVKKSAIEEKLVPDGSETTTLEGASWAAETVFVVDSTTGAEGADSSGPEGGDTASMEGPEL